MGEPLPEHHVLDGIFPSGVTLIAKTRLSIPPAAPVILDGLEHHAKSSATKTTIGEQRRRALLASPHRPASTDSRLIGQSSNSRSRRRRSLDPSDAPERRARRPPGCSSSWLRARASCEPSNSQPHPVP